MSSINTSIVICAFNEENCLLNCLQSVRSEIIENSESTELIIVDNESIDSTADIALNFINDNNELYGILTNGMIIKELSKANIVILDNIINKHPEIIQDKINMRVIELMLNMKHRYFPVIENNKLYGVYENLY